MHAQNRYESRPENESIDGIDNSLLDDAEDQVWNVYEAFAKFDDPDELEDI